MKTFKASLTEATKSQVVVSFGRMNPMTNGHEKLADKIKSEAKKRNADAKLYLSHSTNPKKDPLDFKTKVKFAKKAFGPMVQNSVARTIIEVAKELSGKYDDLIVVVGSDRIPEFKTLLNKYNGKDYTFKTIEVVSAGERDPDAEGVSGMSGSKMRGFVTSNDFNSFKQGVPSKLSDSDAKALFDAVKRGMNLKEELELDEGMGLYRYNKITGYWKLEREVTPETKDKWLDIFTKDSPKDHFVISYKKPTKNPMKEELEQQQDEAVLGYAQRRQRAQRFRTMNKRLVRSRAMQAKRFADPKRLKSRAAKMAYQFFRGRLAGGKNYADLGAGEKITIDTKLQKMLPAIKKFAIRLVPAARTKEVARRQNMMMRKEDLNHMFQEFIIEKPTLPQDKDVAKKDGTQPKKYYVGLDKDTKDARASHFATNGPKSDSDKSAYKDAPGDKEAREKGMQQSKHTLKFKQMYGEAVKTPENRKEISRLDQLVRLGLADTKSLAVIKRSVEKLKSGDMLNPSERNATNDLLTTLLDMVTSSDALFRMTKTQLQKEAYLKCNHTAEGTMCEMHGEDDCSMSEAAYKGNIGAMEMMKFFQVATPQEKEKLKKLIADKNQSAAWKMIQDVTGMKLMGEEDEYDDNDYDETDGLSMAQIEVSNMIQDAEELLEMMDEMDEEPDAWVLSKITKAADYVSTVRDYLEFEDDFDYQDDDEEGNGEEDDGEFSGAELDMYASEMGPDEFGDAYEEFKPILEEIEGLKKKSEKSGIAYSILKAVYDRGMAAWQGGHRPGTTPQQWAFARVNSFITKGPGTWGKADKDLASKARSNEEFSKFAEALEWGTDAMRQKYAADTPGQPTDVQIADHQKEDACCDDCIEEGSDGSTCWDGYIQVGTKMKNGKSVPNCVPVSEDVAEEVDWEQVVNEAEYQGKSVKLNDPFRTSDGPKKFGVYTMGPNGKVVVVRFGDPNMEIKRDDPERLKSYRARHGCDNPGPKWKANYWSCQMWRSDKSVSDLD